MQFTTNEEAMAHLVQKFVVRGIVAESEVQAEVNKIVEAIPAATREAYGETDAIKAANFYETYMNAMDQGSGDADDAGSNPMQTQDGNQITTRRKAEAFSRPTLTETQKDQLNKVVEGNQERRYRNTPLTKIEKILVRLPKPSTYLTGKKVIPICSPEKLAEYEKNLLKTPENIEAFNKIKAAVGTEALPVHINDKNAKIEGAKVSTPKVDAGKSGDETLVLTNNELAGFLVTRVMGRIPNEPVVGVELQSMKPVTKSARHTDASVKLGRPNMRWVGRAQAFAEDAKYVEATCEQSKVGNKAETKEQRLRIADSFKIVTDTNVANGTPKTRTVRLSGTAETPKWKRKDEYRAQFGELSDSQNLSGFLSPEEKAAAMQRTVDIVSSAVGNALLGGTAAFGQEFQNMVKQITDASKQEGQAAASNFE